MRELKLILVQKVSHFLSHRTVMLVIQRIIRFGLVIIFYGCIDNLFHHRRGILVVSRVLVQLIVLVSVLVPILIDSNQITTT